MTTYEPSEQVKRLRAARALTGLDQEDFAKLIGVSRSIVSQYETGANTHYKQPYLLAWAHYSGVTLEWLTGRTPPNPSPVVDANPFVSTPDNDRYGPALSPAA